MNFDDELEELDDFDPDEFEKSIFAIGDMFVDVEYLTNTGKERLTKTPEELLNGWKINRELEGEYVSCTNSACDNTDDIAVAGGQVMKCDCDDKHIYVIPLCKKCFSKHDIVFPIDAEDLVPPDEITAE